MPRENTATKQRVIQFELNPGKIQGIVLGCLSYASSKLWNVANYERVNWMHESGMPYPDWFEQKSRLREHFWYKNLPSQTGQEVLKQLNEAWQSYRKLKRTGGIKNPKPPGYKHTNSCIRFLNKGFVIADDMIRLSIPKQQKDYIGEKYGIKVDFMYIKVPENYSGFKGSVKVVEIIPILKRYRVNIIIELPETEYKQDNGIYMSIDPGVNNLMTCYASTGKTLIISGRQLLSINRYFDKKIAYYQAITYAQQAACGNNYPKDTKRIRQLYTKRRKQVEHLLHTATKQVVDFAMQEGVCKIIMGDVSHIRDNKDMGVICNQKFHKWPFARIMNLLFYKAEDCRIRTCKQEESYSSQCSPYAVEVSRFTAEKESRKYRGLYVINGRAFNADCVGAYNILKKYLCGTGKSGPAVVGLDTPEVYRWNAQHFIGNQKLAISMAM